MSKYSSDSISRRGFLRSGILGACSMCLAGISSFSGSLEALGSQSSGMAEKGLVKPVSSPWFEKQDKKILCSLCPHQCSLSEGERGPCRVRENRGGEGYSLAYGNPALIQEGPVERKPFFHVLPGSRSLSISTAGCNLECQFCEVWDMALVDPEDVYAYDMPPERVVSHGKEGKVRSISYAFGEPVVFYEYMRDVAELATEAGLKNLAHTAGYIQPEPLGELARVLDAVNVDLKSFDPAFYRDIVGGELEPVLETLRILESHGVHIEITNILIPTLNDDIDKIQEMCTWIADQLGSDVPLHFARFYPLYKLSDLPRTPVTTLEKARDVALETGLEFVYIDGVTGHEAEDTFCPNCQEVVVKREGFIVDELNLQKGKCSYCGKDLAGIWV